MHNIVSFDPSFTAWGWVVLDINDKIIDAGCIKTSPRPKKLRMRKGDDRCRRISEINQKLLEIIQKYETELIFSEQPHGSQSAVAAVMVGICLGIIQTISDVTTIPVEWYSEQDAKKCLLGRHNVSKEETIQAISKSYDWQPSGIKYIDEAVADALSVYNVGKKQGQIYKILKQANPK